MERAMRLLYGLEFYGVLDCGADFAPVSQIPSSLSRHCTSLSVKQATLLMLNCSKAFLVVCHFLSMPFQFKPAWKITRVMFSKYASSLAGRCFLYHHSGGFHSPSIKTNSNMKEISSSGFKMMWLTLHNHSFPFCVHFNLPLFCVTTSSLQAS